MQFPPCALLRCVWAMPFLLPERFSRPCSMPCRVVCTSRAAGSVPSHCTCRLGFPANHCTNGVLHVVNGVDTTSPTPPCSCENGQLPLHVLAGARIKARCSGIAGPDSCISFCFTCSPLLCTFGVGCCFPRSRSWHTGGTDLAAPLTASCCAFMGIRKVSSADMLSWALS